MRPAVRFSRSVAGFSLVELMISITLGLLILAGMLSVFASNSRSRDELQRAERQVENGRYAIKVLGDDIQLAGYWAEFNISTAGLAVPTALPDSCDASLATLTSNLSLPLQGYNDPATASIPTCLGSDVRPNTDIIVIRRVSTCVAGPTTPTAASNCDGVVAGAPYFQASLCESGTELGSGGTNAFRLDTNTTNLDRHQRDCATVANEHRYLTHIYYVANNDLPNDGIPTLKRVELGATGFTTVTAVADGVENLQINYLLDTNGDGTPDAITADPSSYNACTGAACVVNWTNVVAVQVNMLVRNTDATMGFSDSKTYTLGLNADGTTKTVGPFADGYKRHVYSAQLRVYNVAGRREP